jgi:pyruvate dehydrogenase E1 component alpha subunit
VEKVHQAVAQAAEKARQGLPSLLEFKTYRYRGHSISDPATYRSKEEVENYKQQDSIERIRHTMLTNQIADEQTMEAIDAEVKQQVADAVAFAETSAFPTAQESYQDVYAQTDYPFLTS